MIAREREREREREKSRKPIVSSGRWGIMFDHEKLDVYQAAITFLGLAGRVIGQMPRGHAYFKDQLGRAVLSIVTNTAEGAGEFAPAEKARFYRIALRSSTECAAILDACRKLGLGDGAVLAEGRSVLFRTVGMLTGLVKRHQKVAIGDRQAGDGTYLTAHARREHEAGSPPIPAPIPARLHFKPGRGHGRGRLPFSRGLLGST